jgi:hypothetical protein
LRLPWTRRNTRYPGDAEISYTNNSPDALGYLWLQLDQNIFRSDSRSTGTSAPSGGRFANTGFTQGHVIKSLTVEVDGKRYSPAILSTIPACRYGCRTP